MGHPPHGFWNDPLGSDFRPKTARRQVSEGNKGGPITITMAVGHFKVAFLRFEVAQRRPKNVFVTIFGQNFGLETIKNQALTAARA